MGLYKPNLVILNEHDVYCDRTESSAFYYSHFLRIIELLLKSYHVKNYPLQDSDIEACRVIIYQQAKNVEELMGDDEDVKNEGKSFTFTITYNRILTNTPIVILTTMDRSNSSRRVLTTAGILFSFLRYLREQQDLISLDPYDFNTTY